MLVTHSGTTDKETLMKASQLMGLDVHTTQPGATDFQKFLYMEVIKA